MKILFICNKSPFPPKEGGSIAMNALLEGLAREGHKLKVLAVSSEKYRVSREDIPPDYCERTGLETVSLDLSIRPWAALMNLFSKESYHVKRFVSPAFSSRIKDILSAEKFDIVQLETLYMCPYIPLIRSLSGAKIVLRSHNIEHLIWEEIARTVKNPFKRKYLKILARKLKNFELSVLQYPDGIAAITEPDAVFIRQHAGAVPVRTIRFGLYPEDYGEYTPSFSLPRDVFHIGSMNWLPNQEGLRWFLKSVWPELIHLHPDVKLYLAGRQMPDWLLHYGRNNVIVSGEVEDAHAFMKQHGIMVVPLFSGSGVRIKIIEGMLAGKAIISTSKGAEGIACVDGEHILIADSRNDFVSAISKCLADPGFAALMGQKAREWALREHNNNLVIPQLVDFYQSIKSNPSTH